jgi:RNA polymerase sigma-70 factor (sigma-E family)
LYHQYAPRALGLAFLLTADWHLAEDLVQEAFVRVAGRFRHLRDPSGFEAYLRRSVVNLHRSLLRRRKLEREYLSRHIASEVEDHTGDVEERNELVLALRTLPLRQRAAVVLRHCMDLSEAQVADALGCSAGAAKNLVARGIKALRADLRGDRG